MISSLSGLGSIIGPTSQRGHDWPAQSRHGSPMEERPKFSLFGAKGTNESSQSLVEGASQSPLVRWSSSAPNGCRVLFCLAPRGRTRPRPSVVWSMPRRPSLPPLPCPASCGEPSSGQPGWKSKCNGCRISFPCESRATRPRWPPGMLESPYGATVLRRVL